MVTERVKKASQKKILFLFYKRVLSRLYFPFNLVFHLSPEKKNSRQIHWHIEVYPQLHTWSGLERGYGVYVNRIGPEKGAEILGAACRKELAELVGIT